MDHPSLDQLFERFDYDGFSIRILYGGSVTADNAHDILRVPHVNGALAAEAELLFLVVPST